jgi:hypothetical protein
MQGMEQRMTLGLNCKVGDLAIVVSAVHAENIGQIVEVLGPQCKKPFDLAGQGHTWQVRTVSGRETLCYRRNTKGFVRIERVRRGACAVFGRSRGWRTATRPRRTRTLEGPSESTGARLAHCRRKR